MKQLLSAFLLFAVAGWAQVSHGQSFYENDNYGEVLQVKESGHGFYYEVEGDGLEEGFAFDVTIYSKNPEAQPIVDIPKADNMADCRVVEMTRGKVEDRSEITGFPFYRLTYSVQVNTSVLGDTGYCLVWVKNEDKETQMIIDYTYVTDY